MIFWIRGRTREIGVLLAVGKTKIDILRQLIIESAILALVGSAIGVLVGSLLSFPGFFPGICQLCYSLFIRVEHGRQRWGSA